MPSPHRRRPTMAAIGILGTGRVGSNLARALVTAGHTVVIGSRTPESAAGGRDAVPGATYTGPRDAARTSDIVISALPGHVALDQLAELSTELRGKVLVDIANATTGAPTMRPLHTDASLAEHLQRALPGTRVVKTLNTMLFTVMTDPGSLTTPPTAFLSGDDTEAKRAVASLLGDLGWREEWIEDLGDVTTARATEALILLVPHVVRQHGLRPFAVSLAR
ncbi:NAD(P)-binding domain-containing protein [Streptantibioticus parmotrematis]